MSKDNFTEKQNKFIESYSGNGVKAAQDAGYSGSYAAIGKTAHDLLKNPKIAEAIRKRVKTELAPIIANREERQAFWTMIMLDKEENMYFRLRASELLARSEGDFLDRKGRLNDESLTDKLKKARERIDKYKTAQRNIDNQSLCGE